MKCIQSYYNKLTQSTSSFLLVLFTLAVVSLQAQPTISKVFTPSTIGPGSVSTITFTITNGSASPVTDIAFSDLLPNTPGNIVIATPANVTSDCGALGVVTAPDGGGTISFADGGLGAFQSCTITVDVTGSTPGAHTNPAITLTSSAGSSMSLPIDLTIVTTLPGFSKSFSPSSVPLGGKSTLTFTMDNTLNATGVGNLDFTDNLPTGMVIADPPNASTDCISAGIPDTELTADAGSSTIVLNANGNIIFPGFEVLPIGATCTVTVDVVSTGVGTLENVTSDLLADFTSAGKASDALEVTRTDLAIQKEFVDDPVPPGGTATLNFTIDNFDRNFSATNVSFTDDLTTLVPALAGLTFSSLLSSDCGGSVSGLGGTTIGLSGGTLAPEGSCTVSVELSIPASTTAGSYSNTTSTISAMVDGSPVVGNMASDDLSVEPSPILTKEFLEAGTFASDPIINPGDDVILRFTVTNPSTTSGATDISFTDELTDGGPGTGFLPFPLTAVLPASACGGSIAYVFPDTDRQGVSITGGTLTASPGPGDVCTFDIILTVPTDMPPGIYTNTTDEISATVDGATRIGSPASDELTIIAAPQLTKVFTDDPVAPGETVTLEFTLSNSSNNPTDATDITFTDDLSFLAGLNATLPPSPDPPCGAGSTLTGSAGDTFLTLQGGTLSPGEDCTFSVNLEVPSGTAPGAYTNTTSGVESTVSGMTVTSPAATDVLNVSGLNFTKEFLDDPMIAGETGTLRFTIDNIHPTDDATISFFTDNLTGALTGLAATGPPSVNTCGGALSGTTFLTYIGGSVLSGASCDIEVEVLVPPGSTDGTYTNVTGSLTAIQGGAVVVDPAVGDLIVNSNLIGISKSFTDDPVAPGDDVTLEFTITNLDPTETITDIDFSDDLDATLSGMLFDMGNSNTCGGMAIGAGTGTFTYLGGSLAGGASCTINITASVPAAASAGIYPNMTSDVTGKVGTLDVGGDPATDDLEILQELLFSKSFDGPTTATGAATLTFTITNPGADEVSGVQFTDDLDAVITGLIATSLPAVPCGTGSSITGTSFLTFSGGSIPPLGGTCSFDVDVLVPATATSGDFPNVTSDLTQSGLKVADPATADLTIEPKPTFAKVFSPDAIFTGGTSTLTFTIDNSASSLAASSLAFTDNLPAGVTIASPPSSSNTCGGTLTATAGASVITLSGGSVGATSTCSIDVDVTSETAGMYVNTTGDLTSSSGNSGTATDNLTVTAQADISVTKTDGVTSAVPGQSVTYTIVVANSGPSDDPSVSLTDNLPTDLTGTYTSVAAGGATGNTAAGAGDLSETLNMPSGSSVTYTVTATIDAGATGTLSNTASATASITDPTPSNNSATDNDTVLDPMADIVVTKTDGVTTAVPGQTTLTYTIVVTNNGPSDDPNVSLTDNLPADLTGTYTSVAAGGATGNTAAGAGDLSETLNMPSGSSVTYTVTATIDAGATGTLSNTASATASVTDPTPANNSATDNDTVLDPMADIAVTKTDGVTTAVPGQTTLTYTIVVTNNGPSDDPNVSLTDNLPADLTGTYTSVAAGGATGNTAAGAGDLSETLNMPSGSSVTYTVTATIDAGATGTLSNTASATASVTDPTPANNSTTDNDTVLDPMADIAVTKTDGVTTAVPGQTTLTYTIVVTNSGPSDDPNVSLTDNLPADLTGTYTSVAAGGATGNTAAGAGDLSETLTMPSGSSVTYTVTATIDAGATGTLSNTASATASVTDPTPANNSATDNDTVLDPMADIAVTKSDGVTTAVPGQTTLTYTIVVTNNGPSDDPNVLLTDNLPADLTGTYTSVATGGATGNTAAGAGDLSETLNMPSGSSVTYTVTATIDAGATGTLSNTAAATASVTDPTPANNSATDNDTVLDPMADIAVTKSDGVTTAVPGQTTLTYTIVVTNNGPSDDPNVSLTDNLPAVLTGTYTSVAAGGATGNTAAGAGDLSETLNMPSGSSVTYTVTATIDAGATGTLSNTASATASVTDPTPANNSATDNDTVLDPMADIAVTKSDGVTTAVPGQTTLTYTIVVTNNGPSDDPSVSLTDNLPTDLTGTFTSVAAGGATGNTAAGAGDLSETLNMPSGSSVTYTVTATIDAGATGTLSNTASATASVTDPTPANNSATDNDTVLDPMADIAVTKSDGITTILQGESLVYSIVVTNVGPSDDPSVSLTDNLPADLLSGSFTSTASGGATGNTAAGAGDLSETLNMPSGSSVTYTVTATVDCDATGTISNTATGSASTTDPVSGNNSATDDDTAITLRTPPVPDSNSPVCEDQTLNLDFGSTDYLSLEWKGPNNFSSTDEFPSIPNVTLAAGGTYRLILTDVNGCIDSTDIEVVINALPTINPGSNSPVCPTQTLMLTDSAGMAGSSWAWTGPNSFVAAGQSPSIPNVTEAAEGEYTVIVTDVNGCIDSAKTVVVINPNIAVTPGSNSPVCVADTLKLTETGGVAVSWDWSGPNSFSSNLQNPNIPAVTSAAGGMYRVVVTNMEGCIDSMDINVVINPLPTATISGDITLCEGAINPLITFTGAAGTGPYTFTYTINDGPDQTVTTISGNSVTVPHSTATPGTFVYKLKSVSDVNGCSQDQTGTATVVVDPQPSSLQAIVGPEITCPGLDAVPFEVPLADDVDTYQWTFSDGSVTINGNGSNQVTLDGITTAGTLSVIGINNCGMTSVVTHSITIADANTCLLADCTRDSMFIDDQILTLFGSTDIFKAIELIESDATIQANWFKSFRAGQAIEFYPMFTVEAGATFIAQIEECMNP